MTVVHVQDGEGKAPKAVSLAIARVIYPIISQPLHVLARVRSAAGGLFPSLHIQELVVLSFPGLLMLISKSRE